MFPTQLHFAAGSGNARAVRVLLGHADVNIEATYQADVTPVKVWGVSSACRLRIRGLVHPEDGSDACERR